MQGKRLAKKQRIFLKSKNLNDENWLVYKDTLQEMVIKHRLSDKYRTIKKEERR
jgi:hypothetical protein